VASTIRSRCQVFELHLLGAEEMESHVRWVVADAELEVDDAAIDHVIEIGIMYFIGDINKDFIHLKNNLINSDFFEQSFFQLGNLSLEKDEDLHNENFVTINEYLKKRNSMLYVIRGNHDNPDYFLKTNRLFSNIILLSDNSIIDIDNYKIYILGGGISVDRIERNKQGFYWTEESINIDFKLLEKTSNINIVLTHKPPPYIFDGFLADKFIDYWVKGDACLENQLSKERDLLRTLYKKICKKNNIKCWISAHQDLSVNTIIDNIKFIALKNLEFFELTNKNS